MKGEDTTPGAYLRFYYCDFLDSKQHRASCNRLKDAWKDKQRDTKALFEWVCSLKPRSKVDAYPMLVVLQEMLKELLEDKLELQLEMLNQAREQIDMLDGDTSELQDQCGRMEEDLNGANDTINRINEKLDESRAREQDLKAEMEAMKEEMKAHFDEINQRDTEKKRMQSQLQKVQHNLEFSETVNSLMRSRARQLEADLSVRADYLRAWRQHAQEAISIATKGYVSPNEMMAKMELYGAQAGLECLDILNAEVQASFYRRALDLDGETMICCRRRSPVRMPLFFESPLLHYFLP